jgi:hypothetical protein
MISAICSAISEPAPIDSYPTDIILGKVVPCVIDGYDRTTSIIRWKFGENGLIRVNRVSQKDRDGKWMRKQKDIVIEGPYTNPHEIRHNLFLYSSYSNDLDSLETLMAAVKRNYGMVDQERIWKRAARNFYDWSQGKLFKYPSEIATYLPPNDK